MPKPTRADAVRCASELLALDMACREHGTSLLDLLATVARTTYGIDVRPSPEDIEAAQEPEHELSEVEPATAADTQEGGAA